jgi:hypothetical protein
MCHSLVTKMRSTVDASGERIGFSDEFHAVGDQKVEGGDVLVGEHANEVAIAEAAFGVVEAHPVVEDLVRAVLDAELLLQRVAAADLHPPAAQHAAAADVEILVHHDHRGAVVARADGGRKAGDAGADHHHVGGVIPLDGAVALRLRLLRAGGEAGGAHARGGAAAQEAAAAEAARRRAVVR